MQSTLLLAIDVVVGAVLLFAMGSQFTILFVLLGVVIQLAAAIPLSAPNNNGSGEYTKYVELATTSRCTEGQFTASQHSGKTQLSIVVNCLS